MAWRDKAASSSADGRPQEVVDFRSELSPVMYGFGDKREQVPESLDLMNKIVIEYMEGMTREAMACTFNGQLTEESLQFAIRKDQRKADRVQQLLVMYKKVVEERDLHLKDDKFKPAEGGADADAGKPGAKKRKPAAGADAKTKRSKTATAKAAKVAPVQQKSKVSASVDSLLKSHDLENLKRAVDE